MNYQLEIKNKHREFSPNKFPDKKTHFQHYVTVSQRKHSCYLMDNLDIGNVLHYYVTYRFIVHTYVYLKVNVRIY